MDHVLIFLSIALYLISLFSGDPLELERGFTKGDGFSILLFGWLGDHIAWYANLPYFFALYFFVRGEHEHAFSLSLLAIVLSSPLTFLIQSEVWIESPFKREPHHTNLTFSGGEYAEIIGLNVPYYLWFAAICIPFALSAFHVRYSSAGDAKS
ncbi:MAG: hypothetical protein AAGE61_13190 [Pseudomonadota bacterium]